MPDFTPLTFTVIPASTSEKATLAPVMPECVTPAMWDVFAELVSHESTVVSYPGPAFAARWRNGYSAIAVAIAEGFIVGHISFVPVLYADTRAQLAAALGMTLEQLPAINVYEGATAWTHPNWRGKGIYQMLRKQLLDRVDTHSEMLVGVTVGLGGAPVLTKFESRILAWRAIPFLSSLIAVPGAGFEAYDAHVWHIPPITRLYQGPPMTFARDNGHDWAHFCHFWVANVPLAEQVETKLAAALHYDLARWQSAIVEVFTANPDFGWKLSFFEESNP